MDISKLRAFLCVAKYRNFTKASEELFISQPALSKKISDFEKELGVCLMKRSNRSVELTPAGAALYTEAPTILSVIDGLTQRIQEISHHQDQQISIACSGVESDVLAYLLNAFQKAYPNIAVNLRWCAAPIVRQMISSNSVDLGFQLSMEATLERNVEYIPIIHDVLNVIVSRYHPLASAESVCLNDLSRERYIAIKSADKHLPYEYIMDYFRNRDISFQGGLSIVDSLETLVLYVSAGLGVSALSSRAKERYGNILRFVPLKDGILPVETDLVWNQDNTNPAKDIFVRFVRQQLPSPLSPDSPPLQ